MEREKTGRRVYLVTCAIGCVDCNSYRAFFVAGDSPWALSKRYAPKFGRNGRNMKRAVERIVGQIQMFDR